MYENSDSTIYDYPIIALIYEQPQFSHKLILSPLILNPYLLYIFQNDTIILII